jgi:hypothetical protein
VIGPSVGEVGPERDVKQEVVPAARAAVGANAIWKVQLWELGRTIPSTHVTVVSGNIPESGPVRVYHGAPRSW